MKTTTKIFTAKKQTNWLFWTSFVVYVIGTLILFSYMKSYEIQLEQLENAKEVCIENHPYLNKQWTQEICGKVVKHD